MSLTEFCIRRPVFSTVLSLLLVAIGLMGLKYLDTRFLPNFESNHLTVLAAYPGASASLIETSVIIPLEDAVSSVDGIDTISSQSQQNYAQIDIALLDGIDVNEAANKVRAQINNAQGKLPSDVVAPQVQIRNIGSEDLLDIGVTSSRLSLAAVRDYLQRNLVNAIEQVPGVALVNITGANPYVVRISLDPKKMQARGLSVTDIQNAIQKGNIELPAGRLRGDSIDYPITAKTKLTNADEFNQLVVKKTDAGWIYLRDVAQAAMVPDPSTDSIVRINNQPGIMLSVTATDSANPIDTAKAIRAVLSRVSASMPSHMHLVVAYDQSLFMRDSIHEVYVSIFIAIFCVLLVIYLFLGDLAAVLVPIVTIPICIFATFGVLYFMGFTIDIITLLGLVLSIGLVVDDAIVMLENIYRYIEQGMSRVDAAIKGSREISFAVIAMTLTLAAVYAPVGFVHGKIAALFKPFAFTLAGAVIISGFVALTLSPMMCSRVLKPHQSNKGFAARIDQFFHRLMAAYQQILTRLLNQRYVVASIMAGIILIGFFLLKSFSFSFMPDEDMGIVIAVANLPSGANIQAMAQASEQSAAILTKNPATESVISIADNSQQGFNFSFVTLKPFDQRVLTARQVAAQCNQQAALIPGLDVYAFPITFGGSMKSQLQFVVTSDQSYQQLYQITQSLIKQLEAYSGLKNINSSLSFDSQQYEIHVNRELATQLGVSIQDIDNLLAAMLGGIKVSSIDIDGQSYDVYLEGGAKYQRDLGSLDNFSVISATGQSIPLSNLVMVKSVLSQTSLTHFNRQRSVVINASLGQGYSLGQAVAFLQTHLPQYLPDGVNYAFQGAAKNISDTTGSMGVVFLLALVFIYFVLCAQFESFLDPLVILLSVPFSVIGALAALKLINGDINLYTIVGLVTLIGLISKHGIMITQFANDRLKVGLSAKEAVIEAASIRLRPILMTTAAMIFGALPLWLATGASATSRQQIGAVIISGLLFGTFFSLILVPSAYVFMHKLRSRFKCS